MDERVLAVLVNYGLSAHIERLLRRGTFEHCRVLLVDNASEPEQIKLIGEQFNAEVLLLDRNYGFAGAVNRAVARTGLHTEILLVNPDVDVWPSQLEELRKFRTRTGVTAVSPVLVNTNGTVQVGTAGGPVTLAAFAAYFLFFSHLVPRARGIFYTRRQIAAGLEPTWLCMACLMVKGDAFSRFGPVPEDELVYAEDVAWGYSASGSGATFRVATHVRVAHVQGAAGASQNWSGALARLAVRANGRARGRLAVGCMNVGLSVRRVSRRFVPGQRL